MRLSVMVVITWIIGLTIALLWWPVTLLIVLWLFVGIFFNTDLVEQDKWDTKE